MELLGCLMQSQELDWMILGGSILDTKPLTVLACAESPAQSTDGLSLPSLRLFTLFISCHLDVVLLSGCTLAV